jgi:hypothetical protein
MSDHTDTHSLCVLIVSLLGTVPLAVGHHIASVKGAPFFEPNCCCSV